MFKRDFAEPDYVTKYFTKTDEMELMRDMFEPTGKTLQFAVLTKEERDDLVLRNTNNVVLNFITLILSIGPQFFINRITFFDRFRAKWSRFAVRSSIFFIPLITGSLYIQNSDLQASLNILNKYNARYADWKMNGDIRIFGSHVKVEDSFKI